jgi:CelD/BcsL family acetyltransferase involved in cellulose biosynthesis
LRIVLHRKIPNDAAVLRSWNSLVHQMERPEVFYTAEWALAVQSAYEASLKPLLFFGYDGDDLSGVACLATDIHERRVSFLAANTGDYCEFLSSSEKRANFVDSVLGEIGKLAVSGLALANLPSDSATMVALRPASETHGFHIHSRTAYSCAQIDLGTGETREVLKNSLIGKKKLRRYLRELEKEGTVTFEHMQSWERTRTVLSDFADAHVARFRATDRTSSFETPERRRFVEELARRFSHTGVVTLSRMKVGDRTIAWNYGFQYCGSWFWYQPTFDTHYEEYSPGYCLLSRIVTDACSNAAIKRVDLGLGAEGYKERFANSMRQTLYVTLTKSLPRHLREVARYRVATAVKRSPKLERAIRSVLSRPGS